MENNITFKKLLHNDRTKRELYGRYYNDNLSWYEIRGRKFTWYLPKNEDWDKIHLLLNT